MRNLAIKLCFDIENGGKKNTFHETSQMSEVYLCPTKTKGRAHFLFKI